MSDPAPVDPAVDLDRDAYGWSIRAYYEGKEASEILERDDGFVGPDSGTGYLFSEYEAWSERTKRALEHVEGRVLDVGCGAGRHALYLQNRGHDVVAIDVSPEAIDVARERGVDDARMLDVGDVTDLDGAFDTILMAGNNFGLVGTWDRAPGVLDDLAAVTTPHATLVAESMNPYATDDPAHLSYHEFNRERGRMPGALRIRIRYKKSATPWYDYLLASPDEMRAIADRSAWTLADVVGDEDGAYAGILRK